MRVRAAAASTVWAMPRAGVPSALPTASMTGARASASSISPMPELRIDSAMARSTNTANSPLAAPANGTTTAAGRSTGSSVARGSPGRSGSPSETAAAAAVAAVSSQAAMPDGATVVMRAPWTGGGRTRR